MKASSRAWFWLGVCVLSAAAFRLPPLINSGAINSDAAVVGLQARHLLTGEWQWHLWGVNYQGSLDPALAALLMLVVRDGPLAVLGVQWLSWLLMVALTFDVLRRRLPPAVAALAVLPQIFVTTPANMAMVYGARQPMVAVLVLSLWLLEVGQGWRRPWVGFGLAGAAMGFGFWCDAFAVVMLAPIGLFALVSAWVGVPRKEAWLRLGALAAGLLALLPLARLALSGGKAASSFGHLAANGALLWHDCLPFVLGLKVFIAQEGAPTELWAAPLAVAAVEVAGVVAVVFALGVSAVAVARRSADWPLVRLGGLGLASVGFTLVAFMLSSRPEDVWAARYLGPLIWLSPFALAPAAARLGPRRLGVLLLPFVASTALAGWLGYGALVDGPMIRRVDRASGNDERALRQALLAEGVHAASAPYWVAYRLAFLFEEDPIVVPLPGDDDRYPKWRERFEAAGRKAYLFHPALPRFIPDETERTLAAAGTPYLRREIAGFTVLLSPP